jgi:hypothetical protein
MAERKKKVGREHELSISRQCLVLNISHSSANKYQQGL